MKTTFRPRIYAGEWQKQATNTTARATLSDRCDMPDVLSKFLRYVKVDTPSDENNAAVTPSTPCQLDLAKMLYNELCAMGIAAEITEHGYVYAKIPANSPAEAAVGFIAHIDVVSQPKGFGVKPQVVKYTGGDLKIGNGAEVKESDCPALKNYVGMDIVTSDGSTILGADDKAGVAEIMQMAQYVAANPEFKHGDIGIAFTPDEEIGHGAALFDVKGFGCDFAYTVDGEEIGELSYETFNGAAFSFEIEGKNIHPGSAKGKMINAVVIASDIIARFPAGERPETTEGREGYYFINDISGDVEKCTLSGIIRDHDSAKFEERKAFAQAVADEFAAAYPARIKLSMRDQYYNCARVIQPKMHIVDAAAEAMKAEGVEPRIEPTRGGTDGSNLSFMGLPCPNIATGGHNAHGRNEFIPVPCMQKTVNILLGIIARYAK